MDAKLVVVGGEARVSEVQLKLPTVIGRGRSAKLTLPHPLVSRQHCEIYEEEGRLVVNDLGSLNGTFVGDQRINEPTFLMPGELLTVGTVTFRAVYDASNGEAVPVEDTEATTYAADEQTVSDVAEAAAADTPVDAADVEIAEVEEVEVDEQVDFVDELDDIEDVEEIAAAAEAFEAEPADEFEDVEMVDDVEEIEDAPVAETADSDAVEDIAVEEVAEDDFVEAIEDSSEMPPIGDTETAEPTSAAPAKAKPAPVAAGSVAAPKPAGTDEADTKDMSSSADDDDLASFLQGLQ